MTVSDYISGARQKLADAKAGPRFTDVDIRLSLDEAYRQLKRVRPAAGYVDGRLIRSASEDISFKDADDAQTVRDSLDRYAEGIMFFSAARLLMNDNFDTQNLVVADKWIEMAMAIWRS